MNFPISRRRLFEGIGALGASSLFVGQPDGALAQHASVTCRIERDPRTLDPANRVGAVEGNIIRSIMPRLIRFKAGVFEWELDAAESISQVNDTTIEFALRPGIKWQQGFGELTAEDVKFSFERFNPPAEEPATYAADWAALDHVEVTGPYTGRLILKHTAPALWTVALADVSGCIVCRKAYAELGEDAKTSRAIGVGPYMIAEWKHHESVTLRADPDYFGAPPPVAEIVLRPMQEARVARQAFRDETIHFSELDDPAAAAALADDPGARIIQVDSINTVWIGMNVEKAPLDDMRVRQAIRLGIDVEEIILSAYNGVVERADSLMAPGLLGYWQDAPVPARDPGEAQRLLAEAGHADGFAIRLTLLDLSQYVRAAEVVQSQLAEIGIEVQLEVLDSDRFWSMGEGEAGRNLELSLQEFGGKADPSFLTQWFVSGQVGEWNWQRWKSEEYDALKQQADSIVDEARRGELYIRMQQLMEDSAAFIWLTHGVNVFAAKKWLQPSVLPNGDDWQYRFFRTTA